MESICPICKRRHDGVACPYCTVTDLDVSGLVASEGLQMLNTEGDDEATAFLVDLVSNRKIPITTPRCKVGRDDLNDIVISGDQSISRFHFVISKEGPQYYVQDGKSRHGTFLNGNQIGGPEPIHDGDVLKVGVSLFWFVIESAQSSSGIPTDKFIPVDIEGQPDLAVALPEKATLVTETQEFSIPKSVLSEVLAKPAEPQQLSSEHEAPGAAPLDDVYEPLTMAETPRTDEFHPSTITFQTPPSIDSFDGSAHLSPLVSPLSSPLDAAIEPPMAWSPSETASTQTSSSSLQDSREERLADEFLAEGNLGMLLEPLTDEEQAAAQEEPAESISLQVVEAAQDENALAMMPTTEQDEYAFDLDQAAATPVDQTPGDEALVTEDAPTADLSEAPDAPEAPMAMANEQDSRPTEEAASPESASGGSADQSNQPEQGKEPADSDAEETLGKLAEAVGETESKEQKQSSSSQSAGVSLAKFFNLAEETPTPVASSNEPQGNQTSNGAKSGMSMSSTLKETNATVPDWCKRYFSAELTHLNKELQDLNEQVRLAQQKIKEVETRVALTRGLRNTLLTAHGEELVEACGRVLTMLGWKVRFSDEDKHELRLETDDKGVSIARIVWTDREPDRSHLGQLSISQTRYWCEQGVEPKGILILNKVGEVTGPMLPTDHTGELAEYATKKNVCLMTTLQLLSVYKEIALHDGSVDQVRASIQSSSGWLPGFGLEPGSDSAADREESASTNKLSSLLSA